ncbi:uncharacterized protein TNCV_3052491 [Trichonephila clavipes]|nr:uncharacterized protein TNCV_3052491 [Trichonephila clavipes]
MPTSARIVERVTVGSTSACRTILQSSLLVVFLVAPDPVFRTWVPSRVHCSDVTAHYERSTWSATRRVDQPAVFIPMIRPLSNSLNCEKYLLARLPGMFRLPKSSYNRRAKGCTRLDVGRKGQSLLDICRWFAWKFFFQAQQQGHEQAEKPLTVYVLVNVMPSCDPVQMSMLFGDLS